ncbi:hypothetical protein KC318_g3549 [Hortaea werneckii]|nr:hypothetical protein KC334_g4919 [Hortaea werneckii]KAI7012729.1 hypothetical protein KC355_g5321 [Hortaea werneckii]KAI7671340.1 hypothetical protein KC318_g3549 [Hortaea werneckii]
MAFIEVKGKRHVDPSTQSKLVVEPAAYFLKYCYGPLLELFKNKMSDNVLVACAYSAGRDWRLKLFQFDMMAANSKIGEANEATAEEMSDETLVMFVSPGYAGGKNAEQGFIKDTQRCNVLLTRGKASVTVIGNPCDNQEVADDPLQANPPLVAHY